MLKKGVGYKNKKITKQNKKPTKAIKLNKMSTNTKKNYRK